MKTLSIIDGSGFLFRAWYAFPPMFDERGRNINVVYGFIRMMLKLLSEESDYFIIAWDSPVKTKRHEYYQEYKANRKKMEDEFRQQIPQVLSLIEELRVPNVVAPGYEADDIIATLVACYQQDPELLIQVYSSDKDLKQFLSDNVVIIDPLKNQLTKVIDFQKEFGFPPICIVDYLALIGDSADNIKGVPGIGPKRASHLIQRYHTLENLYAHLGELSEDLRARLLSGKEEAFFSKQLIELLMVPELQDYPLEKLLFNLDFKHREEILVDKRNFRGLKKLLVEYKKKAEQPQQLGLF